MVAYWLQDAKMAAKTQKMVDEQKKTAASVPLQLEKTQSTTQYETENISLSTKSSTKLVTNPTPKVDKKYSHLLYIPIYTSQKFLKRCESLAGQIINDFPGFEPYLSFTKSRIDVLPLTLSDFQIDMMTQLMEYGGIFEKNLECKPNPGKPTLHGKIKLELKGIEVYKVVDTETLDQKDGNWFKEAHRGPAYNSQSKNVKYEVCATKQGNLKQIDEITNNSIGKLIELGIANEADLEGARFDISQMMYKLENTRIDFMQIEDEVDLQDLKSLKTKFENFNFQQAEIDQLVLA